MQSPQTIEALNKRYDINLKLTIKTPEQHQKCPSGIAIVNFEYISHFFLVFLVFLNFEHISNVFLVFLLLTLNM